MFKTKKKYENETIVYIFIYHQLMIIKRIWYVHRAFLYCQHQECLIYEIFNPAISGYSAH